MRIIIDLQGAQTESRYRGIGRYSLSLALAIAKNAVKHEIWIVLNAAFQESIEDIRQEFFGLIPNERIKVFEIPLPVAEINPDNTQRARIAEKIREYYIHSLKPDLVLVSSLFEGYIDNAAVSVGRFTHSKNTVVVLYDLIPYLNPASYLNTLSQQEYYKRKIESLKNAGLLLAISDFSKDTAINALQLSPNQVINISTAVNDSFRPIKINKAVAQSLLSQYGIKRKMLLNVSGGFDARKNLNNLIIAYSKLPSHIRDNYQLVIASKINDEHLQQLQNVAKNSGLKADEMVVTGYISDTDLIKLYNLADLFIFPSLCEGFGLPVLEAMACGSPVIGSNNTSIPEVIGCNEALFDATSIESISRKIEEVLSDEKLKLRIKEFGVQQAKRFSWDKSANAAICAMEEYFKKININITSKSTKQRLAFISPLPPLQTGIADYSADLLKELSASYEIELIVQQNDVSLPIEFSNLPIRSVDWFEKNSFSFDRILYQFGNSPFHSHMLKLLDHHPGVVVLHDFFLSSMLCYEEITGQLPNAWTNALIKSHGYPALKQRFGINNIENTKRIYPCNLDVIQNALGIIVHSDYSKDLADQWYGKGTSTEWKNIPLVRTPAFCIDKNAARKKLGFSDDAFIICSFGLVDPTKQSLRLLKCWLSSKIFNDEKAELIFVGANHGGNYGSEMLDTITKSKCNKARITGWVEKEVYELYLQAADVSVQLRNMSRGETSASILDCMNFGIASIANANGSMAELPSHAVSLLPDEFSDAELIKAMETLWQNVDKRTELSLSAKTFIHSKHNPNYCANQYFHHIEHTYQNKPDATDLTKAIVAEFSSQLTESDLIQTAQTIAIAAPPKPINKQLLVDVTTIAKNDLKTGIERVVRSQILELINNPPEGYCVQPVYLTNVDGGAWHYRYARQYTCKILNISSDQIFKDEPIDVNNGDIFYGADFAPYDILEAAKTDLFIKWKALGVKLYFLVYDLLPILRPEFFPRGANEVHSQWLSQVAHFSDELIGISHSVASEIRSWLDHHPVSRKSLLKISAAPLGADINSSDPSTGLPDNTEEILRTIQSMRSFMMVSTIEPRKGHLQTISAFDLLWDEGNDVCLIIVGKEGWKSLPNHERRTIPDIVNKLTNHKELGKRLFWFKDASDEFLQLLYLNCDALIAASEGEGFGLPLIEAAYYQLPIIARDIPVFREVAGNHAYYFNGFDAEVLSQSIYQWLALYKLNSVPSSKPIQCNTWKQNIALLKSIFFDNPSSRIWAPPFIEKLAMDQHLSKIHEARIELVKKLLPSADTILDLGGANSPLYKMGYTHPFKKLTLIDLPPDERHEYYKDIVVDDHTAPGEVVVRYTDMTLLQDIADSSVDFVWSGQSIEHVPHEAAIRMCKEVFRVLKKGGAFCLDTPNRLLTRIHTRPIGGGFIHPEHYIEYLPEQLAEMLKQAGFYIKASLGICEMPETVACNEFRYSDFLFGKSITDKIENGYIQFFHCVK